MKGDPINCRFGGGGEADVEEECAMTNDEIRSLEAQADAYQAQADEDRRNAPFRRIEELEAKLQAAEAERDSLAERLRKAREALEVVKKEVNERRAVLAEDVERHESSKDGCKHLAVDFSCEYCCKRKFAIGELDDLLQNVNPYIDEVLAALAPPSAPASPERG